MKPLAPVLSLLMVLTLPLPSSGQQWTLRLQDDQTVAPCTSDSADSCLKSSAVNVVSDDQATVEVRCAQDIDCGAVELRLEEDGNPTANLSPPSSSDGHPVFTVPRSAVGDGKDLAVLVGGTKIDSFQLRAPHSAVQMDTADSSGSDSAPSELSLADLLRQRCPISLTPRYDRENDWGELVVDPLGNVLATPSDFQFDEDDQLRVWVVGADRLLERLKVERASAFRDATAVRILGAGEEVPLIVRQAGEAPSRCDKQEFRLGNFAPGRGQVQISVLEGTSLTPIGSFDFKVNPLYRGMLTLGAVRTDLVDPQFKLASDGEETVITLGSTGDEEILYSVFYTPFVWGKRDLEKSTRPLHRINPTIGLVTDDIDENVLLGLSVDLPAGVLLTFGWHFREVDVLPTDTALEVGSPFSGEAAELPTATSWEDDTFFAASVDLRAIVQLFKAAIGTGSQ